MTEDIYSDLSYLYYPGTAQAYPKRGECSVCKDGDTSKIVVWNYIQNGHTCYEHFTSDRRDEYFRDCEDLILERERKYGMMPDVDKYDGLFVNLRTGSKRPVSRGDCQRCDAKDVIRIGGRKHTGTFEHSCEVCFNSQYKHDYFEEAQTLVEEREEDLASGNAVPPCWKYAEEALKHSRLVLLHGPPGTGKTHAAMKYGNPKDPYALTLHEETSADELRGFYVPVEGRFEWQDGPAVSAWRNGRRLVLNELDHASGDTLSLALAILDDADIAALTLPSGETIRPHPDFHCVATINGDPDELPPALRDRFTISIEINRAHPKAIKALPEDMHNLVKGTLGKKNVVSGSETTSGTERLHSIRAFKAFAELREKGMDEKIAAKIIFGGNGESILNSLKIAAA